MRITQQNPLLWLLLLLTAWACLAAPLSGQKTASGNFYGPETASSKMTGWEAAPRLGLPASAEKDASVPLVGANSAAAIEEAAAGPVNFMGNGDQFFKNASKRLDVDANGTFDVVAHGSTQKIEVMTANGPVLVDQRVASKLIENTPGYNGQPIRLLSCDTGACDTGFAQNLANKMGVSVQAPTDLVWAYGNGKMVVAPRSSINPSSPLYNVPDLTNQGAFKTFVPGKIK